MKPWGKVARYGLTSVAAAAVLAGYAWLLWRGPWWFDGDHIREKNLEPADGVVITGFRTALIALGVGIITAMGLWYTARNHRLAREQFAHTQEQFQLAQRQFEHSEEQFRHTQVKDREQVELTREGQVTDRYVEAIKLLSSESMTQRLGGIYSLQRIMKDSSKDFETVIEVLAAFIRLQGDASAGEARDDVQAAITVIGRAPLKGRPVVELNGANLSGLRLAGLRLPGANLSRARLVGCDMTGVDLSRALLDQATLDEANLERAALNGARLHRAGLNGAYLYGAKLTGAKLDGAELANATLSHAELNGASMRIPYSSFFEPDECGTLIACNLTYLDLTALTGKPGAEMLSRAFLDESTLLPPSLADHPAVQARLREELDQAGWSPTRDDP
ncbi:pentapeptide repeat-containing protein [Streptomyces anandii]|uniref:pentapeptide repeat-containing protein n=1 Tax=Streptomyces anandii TaxID=285454 RepID=UPI0036F7A903